MPIAVVTGANSGIGHALAQHLISLSYEVHAADMTIGEPLQALTGCRLHRLDMRSPDNISAFAATLTDRPVNVLLNVAGVMSPPGLDSLETVTPEILFQTFGTNAFGPLLLTQALIPNLLAAAETDAGSRVGIVSSRVGSIGDNSTGGSYAYRASKAAVNAFGKNLAIDLAPQGVIVSLLHPGIVKTNLDTGHEPPAEAVEPDEAAVKLWDIMMAKGLADSGKFWHRDGMELPW